MQTAATNEEWLDQAIIELNSRAGGKVFVLDPVPIQGAELDKNRLEIEVNGMCVELKAETTGFDQLLDGSVFQYLEKEFEQMSEERLAFNEVCCGKANVSLNKVKNLEEVHAAVERVFSTYSERIYSSMIRIQMYSAWDGSDDDNAYSKCKNGENAIKRKNLVSTNELCNDLTMKLPYGATARKPRTNDILFVEDIETSDARLD